MNKVKTDSTRRLAIEYFQGRQKPFTGEELEEYFDVNRHTIRRWREKGLRSFTVSKVVRFNVEDVYAFVKRKTIP